MEEDQLVAKLVIKSDNKYVNMFIKSSRPEEFLFQFEIAWLRRHRFALRDASCFSFHIR